jgi:hypothetical protein
MRKSIVLPPLALLTMAALPAAAQEMPRVLFCQGQCFGVDEAGQRVPVTKGTRLAPGLRLETGPDSYAQVKLGPDTACAIGERSRVRFDHRVRDKDVVILDQGRIRLIGGEAIGRPGLRPVELHTTDGKFDLKSADIEVKSLPKTADAPAAPTLVKLNVGEARLGDLPMTKEAVQGISGGKVLERAIPIGDIALAPRQVAPVKTGDTTAPSVRQPAFTLPVIGVKTVEFTPLPEPIKVSTAIVSPELASSSLLKVGTTLNTMEKVTLLNTDPAQIKPYVPPVDSATLLKAAPIETPTGTTSLSSISKDLQLTQKTGTTSSISPTTTQLLTQTSTLQTTTTTLTTQTSVLSPKISTTTFSLR